MRVVCHRARDISARATWPDRRALRSSFEGTKDRQNSKLRDRLREQADFRCSRKSWKKPGMFYSSKTDIKTFYSKLGHEHIGYIP